MDPAAALRTMRSDHAYLDDRIEAGRALAAWLARGGFVPLGLFTCGETYDVPAIERAAAGRLVAAELATLEWQQ
jgi:hypothetical protein